MPDAQADSRGDVRPRASGALMLCALTAIALAGCVPASWGANALLHPRRTTPRPAPAEFEALTFSGAGITLAAWRLRASMLARGTLIYLHGVADNRMSGIGLGRRFTARGFDVIAYDSRAHGESGGDACTYGFYEKQDLMRVRDTVSARPVVLFGVSLGAAVALQAAALDNRVAAIVAVETFSDLATVIRERKPGIMNERSLQTAAALAERRAAFQIRDVSPMAAAAQIGIPVLLIHGVNDRDTTADHSRRVFDALRGPKRLMLVPDAGHNESLQRADWNEIDAWLDAAIQNVSFKSATSGR